MSEKFDVADYLEGYVAFAMDKLPVMDLGTDPTIGLTLYLLPFFEFAFGMKYFQDCQKLPIDSSRSSKLFHLGMDYLDSSAKLGHKQAKEVFDALNYGGISASASGHMSLEQLNLLEDKAQQGCPKAMAEVAYCRLTGTGHPKVNKRSRKDPVAAEHWFYEACKSKSKLLFLIAQFIKWHIEEMEEMEEKKKV
ncbi:MAG: hypothetical protein LBQ12_02625 [Deltaproteobacteria bacterium]|nr:hypothetical protein [Deltaproteobacteria bacterium]